MDQMKNMSLADSLKNPHKDMEQTIQGENFISFSKRILKSLNPMKTFSRKKFQPPVEDTNFFLLFSYLEPDDFTMAPPDSSRDYPLFILLFPEKNYFPHVEDIDFFLELKLILP